MMIQRIYDAFFAEPQPLPEIRPESKSHCGFCRALFVFVALRSVSGVMRRMLPFALILALTTGVAGADTSGKFLAPTPWHYKDIMAPYRAFPTPRRVLAMLRFAAPMYGLAVEQVAWVRPGPNEGSDKTGVAEYRYRYRSCAGSARVHVIGGEEIEGGWRLRDVAELQHVGEQCGK
jgi:hypothetical protein